MCDLLTCIYDSLGQDGAELGDDVFVFVGDDLGVDFTELRHFGHRVLGLLNQHQRAGDQGALWKGRQFVRSSVGLASWSRHVR